MGVEGGLVGEEEAHHRITQLTGGLDKLLTQVWNGGGIFSFDIEAQTPARAIIHAYKHTEFNNS